MRRTKESTLEVAQKHFNAPVDTLEGTVKRASSEGVELEEYPGRTFRFSTVGMKMADLVADDLGRRNSLSRAAAVEDAGRSVRNREQAPPHLPPGPGLSPAGHNISARARERPVGTPLLPTPVGTRGETGRDHPPPRAGWQESAPGWPRNPGSGGSVRISPVPPPGSTRTGAGGSLKMLLSNQ